MSYADRSLALRALDLSAPAAPTRRGPVELLGPGGPVAGLIPLAAYAEGVLSRMADHNRQVARALEAEHVRVQREDKAEWDTALAHLVARAEAAGVNLTWEQKDIVDSIARLGEAWATRVRTVTDGDLDGIRDTFRGYVVGYGDTLDFAARVADRLAAALRASVARCPELMGDLGDVFEDDAITPFPLTPAQEADTVLVERLSKLGIRPSRACFGRSDPPDLRSCLPSQARALAEEIGVHPWWLLTMHDCCRDGLGAPLGSGAAETRSVPDPYKAAPVVTLAGAHSAPFVAGLTDYLPAIWWELWQQRARSSQPPPLLPGYEILRRADDALAGELDTTSGRRGLSTAAKRVAALLDTTEAEPVRTLLCALYPEDKDWFGGRAPAGHEWLRPWPPCFTGWLTALYRASTAALDTRAPPVPATANVPVPIPASALVFAPPEPPQDWQRGWLPSEIELANRTKPETSAGELRRAWECTRLK